MKTQEYNETEVFMAEIYPLLEKAHGLCSKYKLPFVCFAQYGMDEDDADNSLSRASISAMVNIPGSERTAPTLMAISQAMNSPVQAALMMLHAAMGHKGVIDQAEDARLKAASKDATAELLSNFMKPGHA